MPKKFKNGFKEKITYENLYRAYLCARKSKRYRYDVIKFNLRYEEKLNLICDKLKKEYIILEDLENFMYMILKKEEYLQPHLKIE